MHVIVTVVFLGLAYFNYFEPSPCTVPGPYGFLTSMWFMYFLMGIAHSCTWIFTVWRPSDCGCSSEPASVPNK